MPVSNTLRKVVQTINNPKGLRGILNVTLILNLLVILLQLFRNHQNQPHYELGSFLALVIFQLLYVFFFITERFFFRHLILLINKYLIFLIFETIYLLTFFIWLKIYLLS